MLRDCGVKIIGSGSAVPEGIVSNADLERLIDTNDEWIVQRTGIHERRKCDPDKGEGVIWLSTTALQKAIDNARIDAKEIDLIILGSITAEMRCPSTACRVADNVGATNAGAFDILAACSAYVYGINLAESLIRAGHYNTIAVIGSDALTTVSDYSNRKLCILFGDAAGAVILRGDDDNTRGCLHQRMYADGSHWKDLYMPTHARDVPEGADWNEIKLNYLQMNGSEVYKFAVNKFQESLLEALNACNLTVDDVKMFISHQSNLRILESTKRRLKLSDDKLYINIHKYGNTSAGSVGLCFDELWHAGKIGPGDTVVFIAIGGGLTWATSVWRL